MNGTAHANGVDGVDTDPMASSQVPWKQPSHPTLIKVVNRPKAFTSAASSLISLPAGAHFANITTATITASKRYTSVQVSPTSSIELNSDLVFCNHSCDPSLVFDMHKMEVRVSKGKDLKVGDPLTFFYPSTEWDMVQPFDCTCGTKACIGFIDGASQMREEDLKRYWLNPHIINMLADKNTNGHAEKNGGLEASG